VKAVKRKAMIAALVWKEFGLSAGCQSHTAPAAATRGTAVLRNFFEANAIAQADHDAGRDR
jgi:hypothetical protein